ncbi:MAG: SurA N-terminal domain-containing protein [Methylococcaceae bacterium]|nr:SurA N-terminal domain-containing protein [Methylococcaceae bacterium]
MLSKIREKTQGTFAWVILILICVPFALWGLQNYTEGGQESAVVIVGDKEFVQRDVNQAYTQFKQQYAEMQLPEDMLKKQAIEKLIRDELLLQHVTAEKLSITDETVRKFVASLQYFQRDGQFDKKQYETLLGAQGMTSAQFVSRIRKALLMEQYQKAITESSFVSQYDMDSFFKIQNQTRHIEYVTVNVQPVNGLPTSDEINAYYQQHVNEYQSAERVSVEYVELALADLMADISPTEEQIKTYYEDNKELYSTKERRKISHILFAKTKDTTEEQALAKAEVAQARLANEKFSDLAVALSDDSLTAKNGGDLGLFEVGVMEPAFEVAAAKLALGEVSKPVKSAFGYHLITVTELVPAETKAFADVKNEVQQAVQRAEADTMFYQLGESLTDMSFENSDNLQVVSDELGLKIKQSKLFDRSAGEGIASEENIRNIAFSEAVLQGHNSEPIELGDGRLVVLRLLEHQPAEAKPLAAVQQEVVAAIQNNKAKAQARTVAENIKQKLAAGVSLRETVKEQGLVVAEITALKRSGADLPWQVSQAVFKAAKPVSEKPTILVVDSIEGNQTVVSLLAVTDGAQEDAAEQVKLAKANIARALGQADYGAVIEGIRAVTKVVVKE